MPYNKKSKKNLKPIDNFDERINAAKSKGQINLSIERNILATLRTEIKENTSILKDLPQGIASEVKQGKFDNAIKLLNVIKEPEDKNININGGLEVQKVYITQEEKQEAEKHIKDFIG